MPKAAPNPRLAADSRHGIWKTRLAQAIAVSAPKSAAQCGLTRKTASNPNSTTTGSAATSVDSHHAPIGSYTCVQFIGFISSAKELMRPPDYYSTVTADKPVVGKARSWGCCDTMARVRRPERKAHLRIGGTHEHTGKRDDRGDAALCIAARGGDGGRPFPPAARAVHVVYRAGHLPGPLGRAHRPHVPGSHPTCR